MIPSGLTQIGWWLPRDNPMWVDENERFISLKEAEAEGGLSPNFIAHLVPVYVKAPDGS